MSFLKSKSSPELQVLQKTATLISLLEQNQALIKAYAQQQEPMTGVYILENFSLNTDNTTGLTWVNLPTDKNEASQQVRTYTIGIKASQWAFVEHSYYTNSHKEYTLTLKYSNGILSKDYSHQEVHRKQAPLPPPSPTEFVPAKGNVEIILKLLKIKKNELQKLLKKAHK